MTLSAWARSRGVSKQRALQWAQAGRIAGAVGGITLFFENTLAP